jgi:hypothetical protein
MQKYQAATLEFSQTGVPTIRKVLLLYKMIQQHFGSALQDPDLIRDRSGQKYRGLKSGLKAGLNKINIYIENALVGDYPLLGAGECFPLSLMYIGSHAVIKFYICLFAYHTSKMYQNETTLSRHAREFYWSTYMTHTRKMAYGCKNTCRNRCDAESGCHGDRKFF